MSTIVDVYLHGSVHLTNPGSEELFLGILTGSLPQPVGPTRDPADCTHRVYIMHVIAGGDGGAARHHTPLEYMSRQKEVTQICLQVLGTRCI